MEAWVAAKYCAAESAWFESKAEKDGLEELRKKAAQANFELHCDLLEGPGGAPNFENKLSTIYLEYRSYCEAGSKGPLRSSGLGGQLHQAWADRGWDPHQALLFMASACGASLSDIRAALTFYPNEEERKIARKATMEQAKASMAERRERFEKAEEMSGSMAAGPIPEGELGSAEQEARKLLNDYGFGSVSLSDAIPQSAQARMLSRARASLELIAKVTGLDRASLGLGGWSIRIGMPMEASSGTAFANHRCIELSEDYYGTALAHEWFHALDAEIARAFLKNKSGSMASEELVEYRGLQERSGHEKSIQEEQAAQTCARALKKLALEMGSQIGSEKQSFEKDFPEFRVVDKGELVKEGSNFHENWLLGSSTFMAAPAERQPAFKAGWERAAQAYMRAGELAEERQAFESLMGVYRQERPGLSEADFEGLKAALSALKRPDPKLAKELERNAAEGASSFANSALRDDLIEGRQYMAQPCEMLARAFESAACYDAASAITGASGPQGFAMLTDNDENSRISPRGQEREAARRAFGEFFKQTLSCQGMPGAPAWLKGSSEASQELLVSVTERLAQRRAKASALKMSGAPRPG